MHGQIHVLNMVLFLYKQFWYGCIAFSKTRQGIVLLTAAQLGACVYAIIMLRRAGTRQPSTLPTHKVYG